MFPLRIKNRSLDNIKLLFYLIIGVVELLVLLCLALELFGIIKRNYDLLIFSCVFRILQVIEKVILGILIIVTIANLSQPYNYNGYGYGNISSWVEVYLWIMYIVSIVLAIYKTIMQFKLKGMVKNETSKFVGTA